MSSGQIFLTLGAVTLLLYMSLNINRMRVSSVEESVQNQREMEVISYGQSLSELMYSQSTNYGNFPAEYGNLNDITTPSKRLSYVTQTKDTLYATIDISDEKLLALNEKGRMVTITIYNYDEDSDDFISKGTFFTAISPMKPVH